MTARERTRMRVLLATDGSNDAKTAVGWLRQFPLPAGHEILALTVVVPPLLPAVPDLLSDLHGQLVAEARRLADDTASELLTGAAATGRVVEGDPRDEIVSAAESWGADLIVVGARGLSAVAEFLLGSVSLAIARDAARPVLVCKGAPRPIRTVTVAIDGSDHAKEAAAWLAGLSLAGRVCARLIGVAEPQRYPATAPAILRASLRAAVAVAERDRRTALTAAIDTAAEKLRDRFAAIEKVVATGVPSEVIVRDAKTHASDLIVLGARGLGTVKRLLLGSVSESVLRHAECPVLIVHRQTFDWGER